MSEHTHPPWLSRPIPTESITGKRSYSYKIVGGDLYGPLGGQIAWISPGPKSKSNAQIIVASPDLLHACKMAAETIGWITDASKERYVTETLRKAIAKAEGRAP